VTTTSSAKSTTTSLSTKATTTTTILKTNTKWMFLFSESLTNVRVGLGFSSSQGKILFLGYCQKLSRSNYSHSIQGKIERNFGILPFGAFKRDFTPNMIILFPKNKFLLE
jgi:hypothetical protein